MNKILWLMLGIFSIGIGVQALYTGENIGFTAGSLKSRDVTFTSNPIEFLLMTFFQLSVGFFLLKSFFKNN